MPNWNYDYPRTASESNVIDLTDTFTVRAPVNFANSASESVIVLDGSYGQGAEPSVSTETHEVIVNEDNFALPPISTRKRKSRPKKTTPKKIKKAHDETAVARSLTRERSPSTSSRLGDCPICAEPLGTNPMSSTNCGHVFCTDCIKKALRIQKKCPTCRKKLGRSSTACHSIFL